MSSHTSLAQVLSKHFVIHSHIHGALSLTRFSLSTSTCSFLSFSVYFLHSELFSELDKPIVMESLCYSANKEGEDACDVSTSFTSSSPTRSSWQTCTTPLRRVWTPTTSSPSPQEQSEETRRPKHRALPANVSKEEFDAHQLTHLTFRSWCDHSVRGKAVDDAHRQRIDPHRGEARMGMDSFFLGRATGPQHAKAVLNCLDFQCGSNRASKVRGRETDQNTEITV